MDHFRLVFMRSGVSLEKVVRRKTFYAAIFYIFTYCYEIALAPLHSTILHKFLIIVIGVL